MDHTIARTANIGILAAGILAVGGCQTPQRKFTTYPPGSLPVHYEAASAPTACLVASVTMAANYLLGERRLSEPGVRRSLKEHNFDESKVADVRTFLVGEGLDVIVLSGQLDEKPMVGLRFWVQRKGYPVICIINRHGDDPKFNHAVVVTGFSEDAGSPSADIVYYLDPSTPDPLESCGRAEFEKRWARGNRAMLVVVVPPSHGGSAASAPAGE